jgi:hypothetical protein
MIDRPSPRTDADTFDVIDDALAALAQRKACGSATTSYSSTCQPDRPSQRCLPEAAQRSANGAGWDDLTARNQPARARLRFGPDSPIADGGG